MKLNANIPLFGKQEIDLRNEAEKLYLKDAGEIRRLNTRVMHLGILHEMEEFPAFGRWNHIQTMLFLIDEIRKITDTNPEIKEQIGISLNRDVTLANGVKFSSAEEFLKCWTLIYSIGHMVGTFATEHALLKHIIAYKRIHKKTLKRRIGDKLIIQEVNYVIDKELVFRIFKIITFLKILRISEGLEGNEKYVELAKFNIAEERYIKTLKNRAQQVKLEKLLSLFKTIRLLSFTILDGYFSQSCVNVNYYFLLLNLKKLLVTPNPFHTLINRLNSFYTGVLYQSPDNMYFHHKIVRHIEKRFLEKTKTNPSRQIPILWNKIITNNIDKDISDLIKSLIRENGKKREKHFGRIILKRMQNPVSKEKKLFKFGMKGGIIYNLSDSHYEIDIYLPSKPKLKDLFNVILLIAELYKEIEELKNYKEIKELKYVPPIPEIFKLNILQKLPYIFDGVTKNIVESILSAENPSVTFCCRKKKTDFYAFLFTKDLLDLINTKLEKLEKKFIDDQPTQRELIKSREILNKIVKKASDDHIFVFCPTIFPIVGNREGTECDFMLIDVDVKNKEITIYFAEIKKAGGSHRFSTPQIKKYMAYFLGINDEKEREELVQRLRNNRSRIFTKKIDDHRRVGGQMKKDYIIFYMKISL